MVRESDLQTRITRYMKNCWKGSAVFELKITHDGSLPFSAVKSHQSAALYIAKHGQLAYKLPDVGWEQKPFDMVVLGGMPAYILVMFYVRGCKTVYIIDIDVWQEEEKTSVRRSLTEDRARAIGKGITLG